MIYGDKPKGGRSDGDNLPSLLKPGGPYRSASVRRRINFSTPPYALSGAASKTHPRRQLVGMLGWPAQLKQFVDPRHGVPVRKNVPTSANC